MSHGFIKARCHITTSSRLAVVLQPVPFLGVRRRRELLLLARSLDAFCLDGSRSAGDILCQVEKRPPGVCTYVKGIVCLVSETSYFETDAIARICCGVEPSYLYVKGILVFGLGHSVQTSKQMLKLVFVVG